jgi:Domain of unknown function (DUF4177)
MRHWQYKIIVDRVLTTQTTADSSEDLEREQMLDRHGQDGWELVSVTAQSYRRETDPTIHYNYTFYRYFFKRELVGPRQP